MIAASPALTLVGLWARTTVASTKGVIPSIPSSDWPAAGHRLDQVRQLVTTNLVLGILTIGVATIGRAVL
jgi:uncharacterized membrane protein